MPAHDGRRQAAWAGRPAAASSLCLAVLLADVCAAFVLSPGPGLRPGNLPRLNVGAPRLCPRGAPGVRRGVQGLACAAGDGDRRADLGGAWARLCGAFAAACAAVLLGVSAMSAPLALVDTAHAFSMAPRTLVDVEKSDRKLEPSEKNTIRLFRENTPSVVFISTFVDNPKGNPGGLSLDVEKVAQGQGSGFVWDKDGHIVTNFHVIRSATAASVALSDIDGKQTIYKAKVVGVDPDKDTAVLKIDADPSVLRPIVRGRSADLLVGQTAVAIGNPFGLDHSLTIGVVSGLGRETKSPSGRTISNVIQTDAAINPGNSGGVLLDSQGALIGMNTAIYSPSGASAGIGFAIPADTVTAVVDRLIKTGQVSRPALGITIIEGRQAGRLGLQNGVLVLDTPAGSPAAKAGIRGTYRTTEGVVLGDIVVGLDDASIKSEVDLFAALEQHKPGDTVVLSVLRLLPNGSFGKISVKLTLATGPSSWTPPPSLLRE